MLENLKKVTGSRDELDKETAERKKTQNEAQAKADELERGNRFFVGRENQMAELKKEIEELKKGVKPKGS